MSRSGSFNMMGYNTEQNRLETTRLLAVRDINVL